MAQYPTSVPSFSNKSAGETIQPAHVNGLQDEIVALAGGLKNGLDHSLTVSTGGLTVSTGSVNIGGPSSLATLQVNGGSTFAGAVTFSGTVTGINPPRVRVSLDSTNAPIAPSTWSGVSWPVEDYDSDGMHSTVTNSSRLTFAASTGIYHVGCSINFAQASTGSMILQILMNDDTNSVVTAAGWGQQPVAVNLPFTVSGDVRVQDTTDYVTVQVFSGDASTRSLTSTGNYVTAFWAHRVSD